MKSYGPASVHEFTGDFIVYRSLVPVDRRLPALEEIREEVGLPEGVVPRKSEAAYARVIVHLLQAARALEAPGAALRRLVYVGDTRLNDGTAFANICRAGGWPGLAFIAAEKDEPARVEMAEQEGGTLFLANRWAGLGDFERYCRDRGFALDEATAVVVDLDKTALGARGRNDHVIDGARVEALRRTVDELLGGAFDAQRFQAAYDRLNRPEFHPFTTDNQDYLAYVCLILGSGLYDLDALVARIRGGALSGEPFAFRQFMAQVDARAAQLPADLQEIHAGIHGRVRQGDPTPFKAFRYNEYRVTVERMGCLADDAPADELLADEIVITHEVREVARHWREQGVLLFALSDKPDEASIPSEELSAQGYRPIHRTQTHAVGGSL